MFLAYEHQQVELGKTTPRVEIRVNKRAHDLMEDVTLISDVKVK